MFMIVSSVFESLGSWIEMKAKLKKKITQILKFAVLELGTLMEQFKYIFQKS